MSPPPKVRTLAERIAAVRGDVAAASASADSGGEEEGPAQKKKGKAPGPQQPRATRRLYRTNRAESYEEAQRRLGEAATYHEEARRVRGLLENASGDNVQDVEIQVTTAAAAMRRQANFLEQQYLATPIQEMEGVAAGAAIISVRLPYKGLVAA